MQSQMIKRATVTQSEVNKHADKRDLFFGIEQHITAMGVE
ncbi:hypothetical protein JL09_g4929 [Pichia kudriavzevii]|uniref:Uncharacterized protein n=1 Tax=Pichia kudriavzevii TaxID=4909 RepID=A0A099NVL0_PICKU|nr:hypothetical protein JL09_g4929 [Pichia kudriavzevii]